MNQSECALLFLAAGSSRRFGQNKLLMQDASGDYLAIQSAKLYAHLKHKWAAITPNQMALIAPLCSLGYQVCIIKESPSLSYSLQALLEKTSGFPSRLVALADMPSIKRETIDQLVMLLSEGRQLVAPLFKGKRGNPIGFGEAYLPAVRELREDHGLRKILQEQHDKVTWLTVEDPGIHFDIDEFTDWLSYVPQGEPTRQSPY
ncbi:MAG: NTP transferase domain-containing protein [Betaproteobacteria bacterium]|nr:NTP transferase domain-containing protein [Betaproteobacteria bacterium]MDE2423759.1 NTP transferase domain-containing protein [Betaproteobacteria bacterium]